MNRDAIILLCVIAVIAIGAGVFFFVWDTDEGDRIDSTSVQETVDSPDDDGGKPRATAKRSTAPLPKPMAKASGGGETSTSPTGDVGGKDASAARIFGRVLDPSAKPVGKALVALCIDQSEMPQFSLQGPVVATSETDDQGRFTFENFDAQEHFMLRVEHPDFASKFVGNVDPRPGAAKELVVRLVKGYPLQGKVVDLAGTPIADAEVLVVDQQNRAMDPDNNVERIAKTDGNGAFAFTNLNPGYKRVSARKVGYATETNPAVQVGRGKSPKPLTFRLGEGSFIAGVVVDQDKKPIPGVIITGQPLSRTGRNLPTANYPSTKSGADGRFRYEGLAPGTYSLHAFKKGYGTSRRFTSKTGIENVELVLQRKPHVRGRVIDAVTGDPVTSFSVTLGRGEYLVFDTPRVTQRFQDENGQFEYVDAVNGDFYLFGQAPGYAGGRSTLISAQEGQDIDGIVIALTHGATVRGKVVDGSGKPVAGARVELKPQMSDADQNPFAILIQSSMRKPTKATKTDANGEYVFKNVAQGFVRAEATASGYSSGQMDRAAQIPPEGEIRLPDIALLKGGTVEGYVYDKDGNPAPGSTVQFATKGQLGASNYTVTTDAKGHFIRHNVKPGIYWVDVTILKGEQVNPFTRLLNQSKRKEIIVEDGGTVEVEIR